MSRSLPPKSLLITPQIHRLYTPNALRIPIGGMIPTKPTIPPMSQNPLLRLPFTSLPLIHIQDEYIIAFPSIAPIHPRKVRSIVRVLCRLLLPIDTPEWDEFVFGAGVIGVLLVFSGVGRVFGEGEGEFAVGGAAGEVEGGDEGVVAATLEKGRVRGFVIWIGRRVLR